MQVHVCCSIAGYVCWKMCTPPCMCATVYAGIMCWKLCTPAKMCYHVCKYCVLENVHASLRVLQYVQVMCAV